ncbi:hypothetical protein PLESTM_000338500 [Pleodorina starrii]|nr:hypothetical protein PLESTM_000338500 [Pleodorina starrii]
MSRTFTADELLAYDGSDAEKPVYIAVKGSVYDVSASREFYGKGGPYEAFAGRECSRALAIMKVDAAECNDNLADCTEKQLKTLEDWITKFNAKYAIVGKLASAAGAAALQCAQRAVIRASLGLVALMGTRTAQDRRAFSSLCGARLGWPARGMCIPLSAGCEGSGVAFVRTAWACRSLVAHGRRDEASVW